jgi:CMP-2-keto-3-deoxyoctulosonic acid synthetase
VKVGHLIVSRMASARFPGKAMAFLYGRPMIAWIVDKAKRYMDDMLRLETRSWESPNHPEAVRAILEKRTPDFVPE